MNPEEGPWYAAGLRFRCTACGACCTGAPGYVWIEDSDIERMAEVLGISPRRFRRLYARRAKGKWSLQERENGDCILLKDEKCAVYEAKPVRCSTFPFWTEILSDPSEWDDTAGRCEGVGKGDLYTREEIERLAEGDASILFEKHARPVADPGPDAEGKTSASIPEQAFRDLERLYVDLENELPQYQFTCAASGNCCDFDAYGHRLYATTLELAHFVRHAPAGHETGNERYCRAWGADRLCKAREGRTLGCRVYFCGPYPVMPPDDIYERYHRRLKALHDRYQIPFRYQDIRDGGG